MPKVLIENVKPGMITSKPVTNRAGIVILNEGIELTENTIERLKNMGVMEIHIKGTKRPKEPLEELLKKLDEKFQSFGNEPFMDVIKRAVVTHIRKLYEGL
mgnify:CR=1 FL=1